jgi:hypothetical protein
VECSPDYSSPDDSAVSANNGNGNGNADDDQPADPAVTPNALELVDYMLREFVDLKSSAEYVAAALWVLHTHVFRSIPCLAAACAYLPSARLRQDHASRPT